MKILVGTHNPVKRIQKKFVVGACTFLLIGVLAACGLYGERPVAAAAPGPDTCVRGTAQGMPGSFADLSEDLSKTVVNIKVSKIEKTRGFSGRQIPEGPFGDLFEHFFRFSPGMVFALTHHPLDTAVYDQHRTGSARGHPAVDRRPGNGYAQLGRLANCILLGMNGPHTMTGDGAVFVGDILHLVPGFVTMCKARR